MAQRKADHFYKKAKDTGYAARSIFKLEELDKKYRLITNGNRVVDLGAAPGSWMQYLADRVGDNGFVLGIDQNELKITLTPNCRFVQMDFLKGDFNSLGMPPNSFHLILSDLAPRTTGDREGDHSRSIDLAERAWEFGRRFLKPKGSFICKIYQGPQSADYLKKLRPYFEVLKTQKPGASRSESREVFVVGLHFRDK